MMSEEEQIDEWVFSLKTTAVDPNAPAPTCVELRSTAAKPTAARTGPASPEAAPSEDEDDDDRSTGSPETSSLLPPDLSGISSAASSPRRTSCSPGWTFTSPYWSLSSSYLLKVTYRPCWQALPEYTQRSATSDWCRRAVCCDKKRPVDCYEETFTTRHIQSVRHLPVLNIRGIGKCRAVRLVLKRKNSLLGCDRAASSRRDIQFRAPTLAIQQSLDRQQQREPHLVHEWDRLSENADTLPPWEEDEDAASDVILLTFAMPLNQDETGPPLLWKVQMSPSPLVAIEAYTVMEGKLETTQVRQKHTVHPTHVYVHGYQSWSFSGSIVRGDPQPTSAMPKVFSGAFNHGGYPAPEAGVSLEDDDNDDWHENDGSGLRGGATSEETREYRYRSDFFTCITSDGRVGHMLRSRLRDNLLRRAATQADRQFPYRWLDETGGPALLLGWLAQHHEFGVISVAEDLQHVAMHASADASLLLRPTYTDWAYAQLIVPHSYDEEPMVQYLHAVASHNEARPLQNGPLLTGWCSWYHYYENISAASLRENFEKLSNMQTQVPTNVAVVDDGYMTAWGDWDSLKPGKFGTSGLKGVANDIRAFGMRPGLWLAPFACDKKSRVAKNHPDWIIRNEEGRPANSSNCGKFFYGLDATNPEVREYVYGFVRRAVHDWGFTVLKIDFLYAACLAGNNKYDLSMTRAEAMDVALQTIRAAAGPDVFLIGCGCPVGTGIGYADGMRVSADTGPTWYPPFPLPWWDNGTLPALRAMIRNSISRAPLGHRWWHNDPDCLLLGETTKLSDKEVASAASIIAMTCGMLLLSDDLTLVSPARMNIVSKIFPMTGATAVVLDLHNTNDGLPSLLRLWCTDRYGIPPLEETEIGDGNHNLRATFHGRQASFSPDEPVPPPNERKRNCIYVCKGLGTWTLLSISNWLDKPATVHLPGLALTAPPETGWEGGDDDDDNSFVSQGNSNGDRAADATMNGDSHPGYHVFAFWSSSYTWLPETDYTHSESLSKRLDAHETEIFHIREVSPTMPQYIGSDIHFSCGIEVESCLTTPKSIVLKLFCIYRRKGHIFLFIPRHDLQDIRVSVNGRPGRWKAIGNTPGTDKRLTNGASCIGRIVRVQVEIQGGCVEKEGDISVIF